MVFKASMDELLLAAKLSEAFGDQGPHPNPCSHGMGSETGRDA